MGGAISSARRDAGFARTGGRNPEGPEGPGDRLFTRDFRQDQ
jgi:hypothetical protein